MPHFSLIIVTKMCDLFHPTNNKNYNCNNDGHHNLMQDVRLGRSGKFLIANYATAMTGIVILILGVYGFLLLMLTPFTIIGAILYIMAGCVLVFSTMKDQLKNQLPPKLRWLLFDATPMELILHSKSAWKVYGLVLATMAMGRNELKDYIHSDSSLLMSLSSEATYVGGFTNDDTDEREEEIENHQKAIEFLLDDQTESNMENMEHQTMTVSPFGRCHKQERTLSSFGKRMANEIMDVAIESLQRKLKTYFKKKFQSLKRSISYEILGGRSISTWTLSWTMVINSTLAMQSKMISQYLNWAFQQFELRQNRFINYSKMLRYLTVPSATIAATMLSVRATQQLIGRGQSGRCQALKAQENSKIEVTSESCFKLNEVTNPSTSLEIESNRSNNSEKCAPNQVFIRIEAELLKSGVPCFSELRVALHHLGNNSSKFNKDQAIRAMYISQSLSNIMALQMATIPSTYNWLRQIYFQRLICDLSFGK